MLGLCILSAYLIRRNRFYYLPESAAAILVGVVVGGMAKIFYPTKDELDFLSFNSVRPRKDAPFPHSKHQSVAVPGRQSRRDPATPVTVAVQSSGRIGLCAGLSLATHSRPLCFLRVQVALVCARLSSCRLRRGGHAPLRRPRPLKRVPCLTSFLHVLLR